MQIEDILKAAIHDAGLESNLEILNSHPDFSSHSTSSSFYSPTGNNNTIENDLFLDDLDLSILSDSSINYNTNSYNNCGSLSNNTSESSYSPDSSGKNGDDLLDENDPFLIALKQLDEHNSKFSQPINDEHNNKQPCQNISQTQQPPRKIIKINSFSDKAGVSSVLTTSSGNQIIKTQPMLKVVSITNNNNNNNVLSSNSSSSSSDLLSLINYRNNIKTTVVPISNNAQGTTLNQQLNKMPLPLAKSTNNASIKVINLSQMTKQPQQSKYKTNIASNNLTNDSTKTNDVSVSNNCVKITKVVSSKNQQNDSNTNYNNLVYIRKNSNQLVTLKTPSSTSMINANTLQSCKQLTSPYSKVTNIINNNNNDKLKQLGPSTSFRYIINNNNNNTSQTTLSNTYNHSLFINQPSSQSNNLHLNILNSNLNRFANINNMNVKEPKNNQSNSIINPIHTDFINNNSNKDINNMFLYNYEPDEEVVVEEEEELGHAETYANYMPSKLKIGIRHPDPIVETSSLASVEPPDVYYDLKIPEKVYSNGALSALQLEAIVYACQKHESYLPNNHRCGFLIGDGAGVGKGRTIAGIIYENYLQGRKRSLWLSVSNDLKYDAQRDFTDIGASKIQIHALNKLKYSKISSKQNSKIKKGVIFSTYSSLIGESQHKSTKKKYSTRLKQLLQWLGGESFDGVIVFDEAHKAKNLVPCGSAKPTKTGLAVLELQEKLPNARIVYASATGASEPKNMAYMVRLGLWGVGTPFNDFNDFIQSIEKRGVGAMEIVAMDMKLRGMYMARQLSFSGVTFRIEEIKLRDEFVKIYDDAVKLWVHMKEKFQEAIDLVDKDGKLRKTLWGRFWSSHQRFFKYLCIAIKVPHVVELSRKALSGNKCVVIGLQSTGEARTLDQLDEYGELSEFVSTAKGVLQNLVEKHFPMLDKINIPKEKIQNNNFKDDFDKNNNSKSFLDLMGVGDHIRQELDNQSKSKKDKNKQKINEILKRLSSYTNDIQPKKRFKNNAKKNINRSWSISSSSSIESDSFSDEDVGLSSYCESDDIEQSNEEDNDENYRDFISNSDDDFSSFEEEDNSCKNEQTDKDINNSVNNILNNFEAKKLNSSNNKFIIDEFEFNIKIDQNDSVVNSMSNIKNDNKCEDGYQSDNSDSLFSITKSVSVQSFFNLNKKINNYSSNDNLNIDNKRKILAIKKKKKHSNKNNNSYAISNLNEEDEDDENEEEKRKSESNKEFIKNEDLDGDSFDKKARIENNLIISKPKPTTEKEISDYLYDVRRDLLNAINQLGKRLPANTLDELIDLLDGPENVAEMTGRKGRIVSKSVSKNSDDYSNNYVYETRNETDVPLELMNIVQKEKFMNGEKLIAIISEAASSGISLQANRRYPNQFRRVHITIELPWSADRAVQQFGRTHRSNQVSAPEYIFLISELAGEKRFAATVAKRLESLGALTHGDRRATESRDLSRFNIDNKYGRSALENVIRSICNLEKPMAPIPKNYKSNFMKDAREALIGVGIIIYSSTSNSFYPEKDYSSINKFLNRLLGCPVNLQNALFTFFSDVLSAVILDAKRYGKWDMGILDLGSNNNEVAFKNKTKNFLLNKSGESASKVVEMHEIIVERGLSWDKAIELYKQYVKFENQISDNEEKTLLTEGFYVSNQVKNKHRIALLAISSDRNIESTEKFKNYQILTIYRPNTGLQTKQETAETLLKKYKRVSPEEAKIHWIEQFELSEKECTHVYRQGHCSNVRNCEIGLRTRKYHVLAGSVLTVWSKIENLLSSLTGYNQFRLQIIRVKTNENQKIVGCVIPNTCLKQVESMLSSMSSKTSILSYENNIKYQADDEKMNKTSIQNNNFINNFSSSILNYDFT